MKRVFFKSICFALCAAFILTGCEQKPAGTSESGSSSQTSSNSLEDLVVSAPEDKVYTFLDNSPVFSLEDTFYPCAIKVDLLTATEAEIYYTLDGSEPDKNATLFEESIEFECEKTDFPTANTVKAKAYYADGTESDVSVHTYFCAKGIDERFTTAVFSITADPDVLTEGPDGIFYGENYELRGDESERAVHLQAWDASGNEILAQDCGLRIYGGASRESSIKSMKLIARKDYTPESGKFKTDIFGTPIADDSGEIISKYKKLVLRNSGNDFQFAYIRDELNQTLAMQAGFSDYEAVLPAVCYLNGEYYGFFWLHENYCDDFFKEKYPNENALGEFEILEGTDQEKYGDEDGSKQAYADEFNMIYEQFSSADLTNDADYDSLCELVDVENYLDFFAFNIYINNKDWPQNNFKCYRYYPASNEILGEGVYDGRWRFLLHDLDYSMGMYEQTEVMANYNNIEQILDPSSERYSPLFAALMKREDCRDYFSAKITEFAEGVLSEENINETLSALNSKRYFEQQYYYEHIENLRNEGYGDMWSYSSHYNGYVQLIKDFAASRKDYILQYTKDAMAKYDDASENAEDESEQYTEAESETTNEISE